MKRTVIKINEELCNGCGICVEGCHEGALQLIDGKARMVSDLYCDGLGACIGDCPVGAIDFEEREAAPYDETAVMKRLVPKGEKTIRAHLLHLKEHNEMDLLAQGLHFLKEHNIEIDMDRENKEQRRSCDQPFSACPGSRAMSFAPVNPVTPTGHTPSQLRQWPVQLHLLNPQAGYFRAADVVLAADCTAYAYGGFHDRFLKNRILAIACPKLDSNKELYVSKIAEMIDGAQINTLTVVIMEVPCCGGLLQLVKMALEQTKNKVPVKKVVIGVQGDMIEENWI
ncbi:4Fe-4S ferredoxin [Parabacteroides sp. 52]|uniref:ATP-binding protein n=1 Tax=unclassified Parabacteroides TaxID=2649774 RepID=UPI0013D7EE2D|nr:MULTISPECIES: 4Fe-4S binding protein [unclassified Parabacteroides]MDH6534330.1 NAD-dependent dihydropyrimidine dehydrogenase PreA subunit [Parabacteroides sp. PM5-20]NDV54828.1 4Fe-4S ferredoxin [Parabacteroides sp. 52]